MHWCLFVRVRPGVGRGLGCRGGSLARMGGVGVGNARGGKECVVPLEGASSFGAGLMLADSWIASL